MKILKYFLYFILLLVVLFGMFLIVSTLGDYNPEEREIVFESSSPDTISVDTYLNVLSWNIGYCGLGAEMDFFFDGGEKVRATKENTTKNMEAIGKLLVLNDSVELFLLQEVDISSKRTYHINQSEELTNLIKYPHSFFATNYKSFFVPVPPSEPMGKVISGLLSISRFEPFLVERMDFPGSYSWPKKLFMLDRCFMVQRFALSNKKSLLIINTHNSAFDGGALKKHEMEYLKNFLLMEYDKGSYILVGGDWNQNPPGFVDSQFNEKSGYENFLLATVSEDFLPEDWSWIYNTSAPTNRSNTAPYDEKTTTTTILDFFLCSPNLLPGYSKTINLNFENSDHQPILCSIEFH